jgi:hypothetical protein
MRSTHPHYYNQYGDQGGGDTGYYPPPQIADQQQLQQQQQQHQYGGYAAAAAAVAVASIPPPPPSSYAYPLRGIPHPHAHDVLCGRGGQSNTHPGNLQWRTRKFFLGFLCSQMH